MNLLGALCKKFQFCGTCNCDCTNSKFASSCCKKILIIGKIDPGLEDHIGILAKDMQSLKEIVLRVDSQRTLMPPVIQIDKITINKFEGEEPAQQKRFAELGLFKLVESNLTTLQTGKNLSANEGLSRLKLAEHLARVDLEAHFAQKVPICQSENEELEKQVKLVKKFGCYAAYLWAMTQDKAEKQPKIMAKLLPEIGQFNNRLDKKMFGELDLDVQAFFLNQAKKLARDFSKTSMDPFLLWLEPTALQNSSETPRNTDDDVKEPSVSRRKSQDVEELMDQLREES